MTNQIKVINPDGVPFPNRVAFSRVQNPGPETVHDKQLKKDKRFEKVEVHDSVTLEVANIDTTDSGDSPIQITKLTVDRPENWSVSISPNTPTSIKVQFIAAPASGNVKAVSDKLTITTADGAEAIVELAGLWQKRPEGNNEPKLKDILQTFGYRTNIPTEKLNKQGKVEAIGDEVISALWKRADPKQPARLYQLAAYHGRDETARVGWYTPGTDAIRERKIFEIFRHHPQDAQTLLPRTSNRSRQPSGGIEFEPGKDRSDFLFGFDIAGISSDPAHNRQKQKDEGRFNEGDDGGHHLRFWPAKNAAGTIIPHTWIMVMDYLGPPGGKPNWDYNDNVYLVVNIKPQ